MIYECTSGCGSDVIKISRDNAEPDAETSDHTPTFPETWAKLNFEAKEAGDCEVTFDEVVWFREKILGLKVPRQFFGAVAE